ncbi:helix-turn-helix transcriptional regulator [Piscinibacter sakaiensis]|uniref:helix-turn-helix domain-containing protein n=1 Tax=Piscinibacter sakaiensis TaxID=1547922 RepID=UPI0018D129DB|nr:helix-turn-helix transcriptional regulator [Piscinibacter sakaiensis]
MPNSKVREHQAVGARIKALRGDLSQEEFAARLGVTRKSVTGWELGDRLPDGSSLQRLMQEFGVDLNHLLGGTPVVPRDAPLRADQRELLDDYEQLDETRRRAARSLLAPRADQEAIEPVKTQRTRRAA